ncbi:MAG: SDR family oxidoreductase [Chthoniobacterales bacterium]|nr:SDR family oxidoreductase [Chthoniobacterales bacterium]
MTPRTYLLAGCTSGMGLATLRLLHAEGHRIIAAVRNAEPLSAFAGVERIPFEAENEDLVLELPESIDGIVYFPGTITLKPFRGLKETDFRRDLEVNFLGATRFIRAALPALQTSGRGAIVLFSSVAAQTGMPFHTSIAAAKGAVEGFARALAAELAPGIRVNCIAPSLTETRLASHLLDSDSKREASRQRHPAKRIGDPAETAQLVRLLLSEEAGFITGQVLPIDGGLSSLRLFQERV